MAKKKNKYDTNPLDPDYARDTDDVWGATRNHTARPTQEPLPSDEQAEAPTRRYGDTPFSAPYPSVFAPPPPVPPVQPPFVPPVAQPMQAQAQAQSAPPVANMLPTSRNVPCINVPENFALIAPYIPYYIGGVLAAIELFLVPRNEARIRFHAAQGLALHLFVIAVQIILNIIGGITGTRIGSVFFSIFSIIFFAISIIRVWKGEPHHIAPLDEATEWLDRSIEPRRK
ncbi:MAG: hypothetical protein QOF02_2608 [Blastocatellia bacterium]|jgi:uncharacterized membrane protein|nr:hypothetical protein [Blastocatellia bacterium]